MVVIGLQYFGDYQNNLPTFFTHLLVLVHIYIYVVSWFIVTSCHVRGNALEFAVKKKCKQRITNLLHDDFVDLVVVAVVDVRSVCQGVCDYGREQGQTVYVQQQWRKPAAVHSIPSVIAPVQTHLRVLTSQHQFINIMKKALRGLGSLYAEPRLSTHALLYHFDSWKHVHMSGDDRFSNPTLPSAHQPM